MRNVGTVVRGIRTPIIKENDDLARIVVDSVINASISEGFKFRDKDVIAITEAVVGISEGNYATIDQIVRDLDMKFPSGEVGVVFPILSRNRFSMILKAIAPWINGIFGFKKMITTIQNFLLNSIKLLRKNKILFPKI